MKLRDLAHSRTGDKGDTSNISIIANSPEYWVQIEQAITAESVKKHFGDAITGKIERFSLPQLNALNFVLSGALRGGVTRSLALDAHGKCLGSYLLEMEV